MLSGKAVNQVRIRRTENRSVGAQHVHEEISSKGAGEMLNINGRR